MRGSGPTTAFGRLPWPQSPALAQFHLGPGLDVRRAVQSAVQSPDTDKPCFEKRTEPVDAAPTEVSFGPFRLLPTQFVLLEGDRPVPLGSRALEILIVLLECPGQLVSKQQLMARVWPNIFVQPANLTVHISALRRMLRDGRDGNRFIINIPGRGYRFVASVEVGTRDLSASPPPRAAHRDRGCDSVCPATLPTAANVRFGTKPLCLELIADAT
jgi:DNA-binding winged helix-turn-helix (wHTH) protein